MEANIIYCGDCLVKLEELPDESIDLIYIDPPFSSNRNYVAFWQEQEARHFEDRFENVEAYRAYMYPRVKELYRVLKQTGSFYYHCDWHASHYIKTLLDREDLFGYNNFRNEIVWCYTAPTNTRINFPRKHDIILRYTKSDHWVFNYEDISIPYSDETVARTFRGAGDTGLYLDKDPETKHRSRLKPKGKIPESWWLIPRLQGNATERLGYPTQKPKALLERIIKASSNKGDIVLDAFCGCGTTIAVAQKEKRKWIGIDISPTACRVMAKRLENEFFMKEGQHFWVRDLPKTADELRQYPPYEFQNWAVNAIGGIPSRTKVRDKGIDGKVYPIEHIQKEKGKGIDLFGDIDRYIPVQVKRTDQVGRPDIEAFETAMKRDRRDKGIFVGFDFSRDAMHEIRRAERDEGLEIEPITVAQIIEQELDKQLK